MTTAYYEDESVTLYLGDCREIGPELVKTESFAFDLVLADPPYAETSLEWDRWPDGWPSIMRELAPSMWCFGSLRMFMTRRDEFPGWRMSQEIVWEKHNGSGFASDRFKRVHELATHWCQGKWSDLYKQPQYTLDARKRTVRRKERPPHMGEIENSTYVSVDGGPRLQRSVIQQRSMHGKAIHPTEKPVPLLQPLALYGCPPGGRILDPFAGSGSTGALAKQIGAKAVLIEGREDYAEKIAERMSAPDLLGGVA